MKLSIVIPCLNEAETLATVIGKAISSMNALSISGEIIIADNGSVDGSQDIARNFGAQVVNVPIRGYGAALQEGFKAASGEFIIMGDADDSYAFDDLAPFFEKLESGFDLVIGNRFKGGIEKGAMPFLHRYLGNPVLSWLGRLFYKVPIKDFHCGLRGFNRESILNLNLNSKGMEFASEMVVKASLKNLLIAEVPTRLKKDGRSRAPHLRTWRDGWRHLVFLLSASPRWLFIYPGISLVALGSLGMFITSGNIFVFASLHFSTNTFLMSIGLILAGVQTVLIGVLARIFSYKHGYLAESKGISAIERYFTLERGVASSIFLISMAFAGFVFLVSDWTGSGFNRLQTDSSLRISGFSVLLLTTGFQILFSSFFATMLEID